MTPQRLCCQKTQPYPKRARALVKGGLLRSRTPLKEDQQHPHWCSTWLADSTERIPPGCRKTFHAVTAGAGVMNSTTGARAAITAGPGTLCTTTAQVLRSPRELT